MWAQSLKGMHVCNVLKSVYFFTCHNQVKYMGFIILILFVWTYKCYGWGSIYLWLCSPLICNLWYLAPRTSCDLLLLMFLCLLYITISPYTGTAVCLLYQPLHRDLCMSSLSALTQGPLYVFYITISPYTGTSVCLLHHYQPLPRDLCMSSLSALTQGPLYVFSISPYTGTSVCLLHHYQPLHRDLCMSSVHHYQRCLGVFWPYYMWYKNRAKCFDGQFQC